MRKYVCILLSLTAISTGWALLLTPFKSWDDLIDNSPEIVIARCTAAQDGMTPKPSLTLANAFASDIDVLSVLKGTTNSGSSHMVSLYRPYRGEVFLLFANNTKDQFNAGYTAAEGYRIVPMDRDYNQFVWDHFLAGKPLKEQIKWIFENRLKELTGEIARDNEENARLGTFLKSGSAVTNAFGNAPALSPPVPPTTQRGSF